MAACQITISFRPCRDPNVDTRGERPRRQSTGGASRGGRPWRPLTYISVPRTKYMRPDAFARLVDEVEAAHDRVALVERRPDEAGNEDVSDDEREDRDGERRPRRGPRREVGSPQHEAAQHQKQRDEHQRAAQLDDYAQERENRKGLCGRLHATYSDQDADSF